MKKINKIEIHRICSQMSPQIWIPIFLLLPFIPPFSHNLGVPMILKVQFKLSSIFIEAKDVDLVEKLCILSKMKKKLSN